MKENNYYNRKQNYHNYIIKLEVLQKCKKLILINKKLIN